MTITSQLSFDAERIVGWIDELRRAGVDCPVRIGIPGPAPRPLMLRFSGLFGVSVKKHDIASRSNEKILEIGSRH